MSGPFSLRDLLPEDSQITVVDVGAMAVGSAKADYAALFGCEQLRVIGFEPDAEECRKLNQSADSRFTYYPYFVGDGQAATFHQTNQPMTGSLYEPNTPLLALFQNLNELTLKVATHSVDTVRLDDVEDLPEVDLFKIDVQGSELMVFEHATRVLSEACVVHTEVEFVEMYNGQPLFADVDKRLRASGFQFHTFHQFGGRCFKPFVIDENVNRGLNQKLWADAVYVRDFMRLDEQPPEKLIKLAVILNDVYQSFDLCFVALDLADKMTGGSMAPAYVARLNAAKPG